MQRCFISVLISGLAHWHRLLLLLFHFFSTVSPSIKFKTCVAWIRLYITLQLLIVSRNMQQLVDAHADRCAEKHHYSVTVIYD